MKEHKIYSQREMPSPLYVLRVPMTPVNIGVYIQMHTPPGFGKERGQRSGQAECDLHSPLRPFPGRPLEGIPSLSRQNARSPVAGNITSVCACVCMCVLDVTVLYVFTEFNVDLLQVGDLPLRPF